MASKATVRVWSGLVVATGVMVVFEMTDTFARTAGPVEGAAMIAAGLIFAVLGTPLAAGLVAATSLLAYIGPHPATQIVFVFWGSMALALFAGEQLRFVLRAQVAICYLFAAANKLFEPFLSGHILDQIAPWLPAPKAVAVAVVATEAALGVIVLARWRWAPLLVLGLHAPIAVFAARDFAHGLTLAVYGGLMLWATTIAVGGRDRRPESDAAGLVVRESAAR